MWQSITTLTIAFINLKYGQVNLQKWIFMKKGSLWPVLI